MSPEEFERIRWASHVPTREELEAKEQACKKEKEAIVVATPPPPLQRNWLGRGWLPTRRGALVRGP